MLAMTSRIVHALNGGGGGGGGGGGASAQPRNVFLVELKQNKDASCVLSSLVKICLNGKYRTIKGLEDLIQGDWFLAGHPFSTRLNPSEQISLHSANNADELVVMPPSNVAAAAAAAAAESIGDQRRNSRTSNISMLTTSNTGHQSANNGDAGGRPALAAEYAKNTVDIAPTFLLFLDCLFQLSMQHPASFEFNEFYLINLWDYSCSGISFTYSFNGISDWLSYLNNQTFLDMSPSSGYGTGGGGGADLDAIGVACRGSLPKFENAYLESLFETNNHFWLEHLRTEARSSYLNRKFTPAAAADTRILMLDERIHTLQFWSRCYLRWNEKVHAYNTLESDTRSPDVKLARKSPTASSTLSGLATTPTGRPSDVNKRSFSSKHILKPSRPAPPLPPKAPPAAASPAAAAAAAAAATGRLPSEKKDGINLGDILSRREKSLSPVAIDNIIEFTSF